MPTISLTSVRVLRDTNETNPDEPYVIVSVADLSDVRPLIGAIPRVWTRIVGPWSGADKNDLLTLHSMLGSLPDQPRPGDVWDINGQNTPIGNPDSVVILVAMMEHDDSPIGLVRTAVHGGVTGAALRATFESVTNRGTVVTRLRDAMRGAIDSLGDIPINTDERLGDIQELRLTAQDVGPTASSEVERQLTFAGDGGRYQVSFTIRNR